MKFIQDIATSIAIIINLIIIGSYKTRFYMHEDGELHVDHYIHPALKTLLSTFGVI
jgi:hypothetical protein